MKKSVIALFFLALIAINISWLLTFNRPDSQTFQAFFWIDHFFWKSMSSLGQIFLTIMPPEFKIVIHSPENITYEFNKTDVFNISLNVSSNRESEVESWWYSLEDLKHNNQTIYSNLSFSPNSSFVAVRFSNRLTVYANNSQGRLISNSTLFFVKIPNSAPFFGNFDNESYICEGDTFIYIFNVTDEDEEPLEVTLDPTGPFYPDSYAYVNLTTIAYQIFSGPLGKNDIGFHQENVDAAEIDLEASASRQINISVIEINNAPVIQNISSKTIWTKGENSSFYFQAPVSDTECGLPNSGNFTFRLIFSSPPFFGINGTGIINLTANSSSIGAYTISLCAEDKDLGSIHQNISLCNNTGLATEVCKNFSLFITDLNRVPRITSYYPLTFFHLANSSASLYHNVSAVDPDGTSPDFYWYADDSLKAYEFGINSSNISSFNYSFVCDDGEGHHNISVVVSDGDLNVSLTWNYTVSLVNCGVPPCTDCDSGSGGGGGGGGSSSGTKKNCTIKPGCNEWGTCINIESAYSKNLISALKYQEILANCTSKKLSLKDCGYQIRNCTDVNNCTANNTFIEMIDCQYLEKPSCKDKIKNCHDGKCEILVDCGGPCKPCPTCEDGMKNQNEEGVDCGGPCNPCVTIQTPGTKQRSVLFTWLLFLLWLLLLIIIIILIRRYLKNREKKKFYSKGGEMQRFKYRGNQ